MTKGKESAEEREAMRKVFAEMKDQFSDMAKEFKNFQERRNSVIADLEDAMIEMSVKLNY